jgi:hypothetical protein
MHELARYQFSRYPTPIRSCKSSRSLFDAAILRRETQGYDVTLVHCIVRCGRGIEGRSEAGKRAHVLELSSAGLHGNAGSSRYRRAVLEGIFRAFSLGS